jgi:hypothetical protein
VVVLAARVADVDVACAGLGLIARDRRAGRTALSFLLLKLMVCVEVMR